MIQLLSVGNPGTWRPWPLRMPFLFVFIFLCLALCLAVELILQACSPTGCHVFGALSTNAVSSESNFVYNFLPTILSVCFTLLWAVVHHDVLRMEPYFQMSAVGGALAEDSILLGYPYMFPLLVPVLAWKRRYVILVHNRLFHSYPDYLGITVFFSPSAPC